MAKGEQPINHSIVHAQQSDKVVYLPSCASRVFAADEQADDRRSIMQVMHSLATKAGIELLLPMQINELCCGMPFASKGLPEQAKSKAEQLLDIAQQVSENGRYPIIFDASPCALTSNEAAQQRGLTVLESAEFAYQYLLPKLTITAQPEPVMLHVTCSSKRRGSEQQLVAVAKACSNEVIIPADIECCGFAGDKGFNLPELNANALKTLRNQVPQNCSSGISNSRSCEIGLTQHSGINYQSVLYLLDKVSQAAS